MKKRSAVLASAGLLTAVVGVAYWFGNSTPRFDYDAPIDSPMTEADALHYAEKAIVDAGLAQHGMAPVPYWPDSQFSDPQNAERLFARNRLNSHTGYVMWNIRYTVHLEQTEDSVACTVSRMK